MMAGGDSRQHRLRQRIDRRGTVLAILGVMDIGYGAALLAGRSSLQFVVPTGSWGFVWIAAGLAIASGAILRSDRWQFAVAACLKAGWAMAVILHFTIGHGGSGLWGLAVFWTGFAALVFAISGWPRPPLK